MGMRKRRKTGKQKKRTVSRHRKKASRTLKKILGGTTPPDNKQSPTPPAAPTPANEKPSTAAPATPVLPAAPPAAPTPANEKPRPLNIPPLMNPIEGAVPSDYDIDPEGEWKHLENTTPTTLQITTEKNFPVSMSDTTNILLSELISSNTDTLPGVINKIRSANLTND